MRQMHLITEVTHMYIRSCLLWKIPSFFRGIATQLISITMVIKTQETRAHSAQKRLLIILPQSCFLLTSLLHTIDPNLHLCV